jgi:DNA-binding PadR family transcriptional regulator
MHGYQIIGLINDRSGGMWRVSAGSVYPTLQQLEDEGLVKGEQKDGRNVYSLTEDGVAAAARSSQDRAPWDMAGSAEASDLRSLIAQVAAAAMQVSQVGGAQTVAAAATVLTEARRSLYRLLAEDDQSGAATGTTGTTGTTGATRTTGASGSDTAPTEG